MGTINSSFNSANFELINSTENLFGLYNLKNFDEKNNKDISANPVLENLFHNSSERVSLSNTNILLESLLCNIDQLSQKNILKFSKNSTTSSYRHHPYLSTLTGQLDSSGHFNTARRFSEPAALLQQRSSLPSSSASNVSFPLLQSNTLNSIRRKSRDGIFKFLTKRKFFFWQFNKN